MAKMGISTIQSYRGAQIFEAVGLNSDVVDKYFTWTPSRIEGVGLDVIAEEALARHRHAFPGPPGQRRCSMPAASINGATAANFICSIRRRSTSCKTPAALGSYKIFKEYAELVNNQAKNLCTLRGLLDFKFARQADSDRGSRIGRGNREALQDRRDELRLDFARKRTRRSPSP